MTLAPSLEVAWQDVDSSFERFCLTAGIGALEPYYRSRLALKLARIEDEP
jgi:hypothetical protein